MVSAILACKFWPASTHPVFGNDRSRSAAGSCQPHDVPAPLAVPNCHDYNNNPTQVTLRTADGHSESSRSFESKCATFGCVFANMDAYLNSSTATTGCLLGLTTAMATPSLCAMHSVDPPRGRYLEEPARANGCSRIGTTAPATPFAFPLHSSFDPCGGRHLPTANSNGCKHGRTTALATPPSLGWHSVIDPARGNRSPRSTQRGGRHRAHRLCQESEPRRRDPTNVLRAPKVVADRGIPGEVTEPLKLASSCRAHHSHALLALLEPGPVKPATAHQ